MGERRTAHPLLTAYETLTAKAASASPARITYEIAISQREAARNALNEALHGTALPGWSNLSDAQRADIEAHVRGLNDGPETYSMDKPPRNWRCFHCGEVFRTEDGARLHFGTTTTDRPVCSTPPSRPQGEEGLWRPDFSVTTTIKRVWEAGHDWARFGRESTSGSYDDIVPKAVCEILIALSNQRKPSS